MHKKHKRRAKKVAPTPDKELKTGSERKVKRKALKDADNSGPTSSVSSTK